MRILLADDEELIAQSLAHYLETLGHETCVVTTGGIDVLPACDHFHPDVAMLDVLMPRFDGITIARALHGRSPDVKVILFSGTIAVDHPYVAGTDAVAFLAKPFKFEDVRRVLDGLTPPAKKAAA